MDNIFYQRDLLKIKPVTNTAYAEQTRHDIVPTNTKLGAIIFIPFN